MKIQSPRQFLARLAARRLARAISLGIALVAGNAYVSGPSARAAVYTYTGGSTGVWSTTTVWSPNGVPGSTDTALFSGAVSQQVLLGGNQAAFGLQFTATAGTSSIRASAAGNILSLGTGGITYGSTQTDLGGNGANAMVFSLQGSQSWTGSGSGLIQLNSGVSATTQSITNGTNGAITLTFDGAGIGTRSVGGAIDDGVLGGTTAITYASTGTSFGALILNGTSTYSGGTNFNQGYQLQINNGAAFGTGPLNIGGAALSGTVLRPIVSTVLGGITLTNNNAQNWNADFTLTGSQNINFGTGAVTLGGNRTIIQNPTTNAVTYTEAGNIGGAFSLSTTTQPAGAAGYTPGINSALVLSGTNTYSGGTNITFGLVNFANAAAIPTTGQIVLGGGALAVGPGTAFPTLASVAANTSVTRTSGALALTADSAENFTAPNTNISLGAALGSVVRYTGTITTSGNNYNLGGGGGTIVFGNNGAFTGAKSITTNGGPQTSQIGGGGTVIITGQNDATGNGATGVNIGLGTLQVSSINSVVGGTATSNLGAPTVAANGTINIGGSGPFSQLRYTGPGETTDRLINFAGFSGSSFSFDASGTGPLVFSTTTINQGGSAASKNLILRGINTDANTIVGGIGTSGTNNGSDALAKQMRGNWTLSGANNLTSLTINGGTLTGDYTTNQVFTTSTPTLTLGGGTLAILGNGAGTTAQTIGNVTLTANTGQSNLTVTGNGTAGSAIVTLGAATLTRNANTFLNFNLLNGGQVTSTSTALTNGVLVGTGTPLAAFTVTNPAGTDFATIVGGQVVKLAANTALPAAGAASTTNYVLAGSQTLTANATVNSLRIDTSAGGGTLAVGAFNVTPTTGVILKDGANPYTISGTSIGAPGSAVVLSSFGAGNLTVSAAVTTGAGSLTKTGTGLVDLTGANAYTGATNVYGGVLRASNTSFGTGNIVLNTGGILELGADLNGAAVGDFNRQVGMNAGQVQWANGDGGFSAFGGNRIVNLVNNFAVAGGQLVWGSANGNNFVTSPNASPAFVKDGFALLLSSSSSDSTIDFQNPIDFVNVPRAVVVGDGTATVDAVLSGVLSSSDYSGGLDKSGAGTLAVTAANTYTGETRILAGTLQIGNGGTTGALSASSPITNNGTLAFNRTDTLTQGTDFAGTISGTGIVIQLGTGTTILSGNNTYSGGTNVNGGVLLVNNVQVLGVGSGTGSGAVTVNNGGALGGTGFMLGAVTVNAGGKITGGTLGSVGTLTLQSGLTFTGSAGNLAAYVVNIGAGTNNSDRLAIAGTLNLSGSFDQITFTGTPDGTSNYILATYGSVTGTFNVGTAPAGYAFRYTPTELDLVAVPEPSTWVIFAGMMVGAAVWTRRKRVGSLVA